MLFLTANRILTKNRERTFLTSQCGVAATTLTVKAVDTNAWADNDWIILGEIGMPTSEVLQLNGAVSDGTSLVVDNAGSGGTRFAHAVDEPVYRIDYNKVRFYRATTVTGAKTTLATNELQTDDFETRYDDSTNTTGFGFVAFFNSFTSGVSPFSDAIPYAGQSAQSLARLIDKVRSLTDEQADDFISDTEIVEAINDKQRDIVNERMWTFDEVEYTTSSVANQFEYDISSNIKTLHTVRFRTSPLVRISEARWEMLHWRTSQTTAFPWMVCVWSDKIRIWPQPSDAAAADALNGAISSTDVTLTLDDTTSFTRGDYFRFIIDSEVIYATGSTATTFTGCLRGREGTTAASHLDNAVVTERDIIFAGQAVAVDLVGLNDETIVPEAIVVAYGVSADFCHGKLNKQNLGDRYDLKYTAGMKSLEDRFTLKLTSQFGRVKDPSETMNGTGKYQNPNDFPSGVVAP